MNRLFAVPGKTSMADAAAMAAMAHTPTKPAPHHRGETVLALDGKQRLNPQLVSMVDPMSVDAERYRRLRLTVEKMRKGSDALLLGITSPVSGDGKTLTSLNLAGALAQNPQSRVLLIELDLRQPYNSIKDYLGIKKLAGTGVTDLLQNPALHQEAATYYLSDYNLYVLPAGSRSASPYELMNSARMREVLVHARQHYDYVIIDTAPVVLLPDSQLINDWIDGFLVVIAADITARKLLDEALSLMKQDKVLGLVFNGYTQSSKTYAGYY